MTRASTSQGVTLQRNADGSNYTTIAEILSWSGPNETARQIDVTSLDSTQKEYIGGLIDGGEVSFEMNFVGSDTQQQGLRADMAARTVRNFRIVLNDQGPDIEQRTTITFSAVVTALGMKGGVDTPVTSGCTLKMTGAPTIVYSE